MAATALAIHHGEVPPTINLHSPDPACDLDYVPNRSRVTPVRAALVNGFGFGGQNGVVALGRVAFIISTRPAQRSGPGGVADVSTMEQRVLAIVAEQLRVPSDQVTAESHLLDDLHADSLDVVDLTIAIEEEFSSDDEPIEISEDAAAEMRTVQDIITYLEDHGAV